LQVDTQKTVTMLRLAGLQLKMKNVDKIRKTLKNVKKRGKNNT